MAPKVSKFSFQPIVFGSVFILVMLYISVSNQVTLGVVWVTCLNGHTYLALIGQILNKMDSRANMKMESNMEGQILSGQKCNLNFSVFL